MRLRARVRLLPSGEGQESRSVPCLLLLQAVGDTVGTETVQRHPGLGDGSGGLGRPPEGDGRFGEAQLTPVILVLPHSPNVAVGRLGL